MPLEGLRVSIYSGQLLAEKSWKKKEKKITTRVINVVVEVVHKSMDTDIRVEKARDCRSGPMPRETKTRLCRFFILVFFHLRFFCTEKGRGLVEMPKWLKFGGCTDSMRGISRLTFSSSFVREKKGNFGLFANADWSCVCRGVSTDGSFRKKLLQSSSCLGSLLRIDSVIWLSRMNARWGWMDVCEFMDWRR